MHLDFNLAQSLGTFASAARDERRDERREVRIRALGIQDYCGALVVKLKID